MSAKPAASTKSNAPTKPLSPEKPIVAEAPVVLTYTSPTIAASGGTFTHLQSEGLTGRLNRLITANTFSPEVNALLGSVKKGDLNRLHLVATSAIDAWLHGEPIATADVNAKLVTVATALKAYLAALEETTSHVVTNPGTLVNGQPFGTTTRAKRTFP